MPLDDQLRVYPPKTVPDALQNSLFGQTDPDRPLHTYAILDAAKVTNLPELLSTSKLEHRCLFKGQAADDLKNVAPWVVKLEADNTFTRHLFTHDPVDDVPWYLWDKEAGIYIRSTATLDQLRAHFRKFTKVQDDAKKWFYFRFWEPSVLISYFKDRMIDSDKIDALFKPFIHRMIAINPLDKETFCFERDPEQPRGPQKKFIIDLSDKRAFRQPKEVQLKKDVHKAIEQKFAKKSVTLEGDLVQLVDYVFNCLKQRDTGEIVRFKDCYKLTMLVILFDEQHQTILEGPLLNNTHIPISKRVELLEKSYVAAMKRLTKGNS
ncbi:DUF4123 domain-containing protein [Parasulfitobacter algicola]|uniref:DUF4123 domain-containing protein n=1 Tax=Parasulfitobacter algicola TaxID=2614809 RepID=A0ABX2IXU1_9RHOB|nr:DUF4123 domain-containing protein [Sulfitobacter algicola]NSX56065.1 DUF4123 domain-containing protein [Sulfitobacter algicola]